MQEKPDKVMVLIAELLITKHKLGVNNAEKSWKEIAEEIKERKC